MKHFQLMNDIEHQVIRLAEMRKTLTVIVNGIEGSDPDEVAAAVGYIEGSIADISEQLSDKFYELYKAIANE